MRKPWSRTPPVNPQSQGITNSGLGRLVVYRRGPNVCAVRPPQMFVATVGALILVVDVSVVGVVNVALCTVVEVAVDVSVVDVANVALCTVVEVAVDVSVVGAANVALCTVVDVVGVSAVPLSCVTTPPVVPPCVATRPQGSPPMTETPSLITRPISPLRSMSTFDARYTVVCGVLS